MKVLITAGGTREYIDGVRVLTNISSGKLGAQIAYTFLKDPSITHVTLLNTSTSISLTYCTGADFIHDNSERFKNVIANSTKEVFEQMRILVPEHDVVIHSMAVSDFSFIPMEGKLKSNNAEAFIESMRQRIVWTPKIILNIKDWNPNCLLISFKFENSGDENALMESALESMRYAKSDFVVANDKQLMQEAGKHTAIILADQYIVERPESKEDIAISLLKIVKTFT